MSQQNSSDGARAEYNVEGTGNFDHPLILGVDRQPQFRVKHVVIQRRSGKRDHVFVSEDQGERWIMPESMTLKTRIEMTAEGVRQFLQMAGMEQLTTRRADGSLEHEFRPVDSEWPAVVGGEHD